MYFRSFDTFHIILTSLFFLSTLGLVFFRYKRSLSVNEKSVNYTVHRSFSIIRLASLVLSVILLGTAILEPMGLLLQNPWSRTEGMDCVWLLDVSASMDVEDVTENTSAVSRLAKAKSVMENYMVTHPENRYGLVIFAGKSRLVSPLTSDSSSLLSFLASIDSKSIGEGWTDFRDALQLATDRFESTDNLSHAIVLLSDGGDPEDAPDADILRGIFQGKHANLVTVGIGQTKTSPIPVGRNPLWDTMYKRFQGQTVLSWLNRQSLKTLAEAGDGSYLEGDSLSEDLEKSLSSVSRHSIQGSWDDSTDATIRILITLSFLLFLVFLLLPSHFLKAWSAW